MPLTKEQIDWALGELDSMPQTEDEFDKLLIAQMMEWGVAMLILGILFFLAAWLWG